MTDLDLIPGERLVGSYLANLVIRSHEYGLGPFPVAGNVLGGNEAIGGRLHLTSRRLAFAAHRHNRIQGRLILVLPAIVELGSTRVFLRRHLTVTTHLRTYRLGVWRRKAVASAIDQACSDLASEDFEALRNWLASNPEADGTEDPLSELSTQEALEWLARSS